MDKRKFLLAAGTAAAAALPSMPALAAKRRAKAGAKSTTAKAAGSVAPPAPVPRPPSQPAVLTIAGRIGRSNRGPVDDALDQLMKKQGVAFDKAYALTLPDIQRLPAATIRPTLEYDGKPHELRGPLLVHVLRAAGVDVNAGLQIRFHAIDGYAPSLPVAEAYARQMILATHVDGQPLGLGGLGPLWAVIDADNQSDLRDKPLGERFASCPWGLYLIEVLA
jgi:hypothetical protein